MHPEAELSELRNIAEGLGAGGLGAGAAVLQWVLSFRSIAVKALGGWGCCSAVCELQEHR